MKDEKIEIKKEQAVSRNKEHSNDIRNPEKIKIRAYRNTPHKRRSIRLKNYDYSKVGLYFITLCAKDRHCIFGKIIHGKMHLNTFGQIAEEEWKNTSEIRKNTSLGEYIIMPNHFHAIISIDYQIKKTEPKDIGKFQSPSQTIGAIIRGFKGATTKRINNLIREIRNNSGSTGESQFAPTEQFAPTRNLALTEQFAPTENLTLKDINLSGKGSIWQRNYYEHIIKSEKAFNNISNYIINNPKNWDNDKFINLK